MTARQVLGDEGKAADGDPAPGQGAGRRGRAENSAGAHIRYTSHRSAQVTDITILSRGLAKPSCNRFQSSLYGVV